MPGTNCTRYLSVSCTSIKSLQQAQNGATTNEPRDVRLLLSASASVVVHLAMLYATDALALAVELLGYALHLLALPGAADLLRRAASAMRARAQRSEYDASPPSPLFAQESSCSELHTELRTQTFGSSRRPVSALFVIFSVHLAMLSLAVVFDWRWYPQSDGSETLKDVAMRQYVTTALTMFATIILRSKWWCAAAHAPRERSGLLPFPPVRLSLIDLSCTLSCAHVSSCDAQHGRLLPSDDHRIHDHPDHALCIPILCF